MPKKNKNGKTAKEVREISERLYGSSPANHIRKDEDNKGIVLKKGEVDIIVDQLYEKDPNKKRIELSDKAQSTALSDRAGCMGYQERSKEEIEEKQHLGYSYLIITIKIYPKHLLL